MKRRAFLAIGFMASILGLTIVVDTAFADGCCCCCCCNCCGTCPQEMASCGQTACLSPAIICLGQSPANCKPQDATSILFSEVNNFPTSCVPNPGFQTKCDKPLQNCSRNTQCVIGSDGNCGTDPASNGVWQSAAKPTTNPC